MLHHGSNAPKHHVRYFGPNETGACATIDVLGLLAAWLLLCLPPVLFKEKQWRGGMAMRAAGILWIACMGLFGRVPSLVWGHFLPSVMCAGAAISIVDGKSGMVNLRNNPANKIFLTFAVLGTFLVAAGDSLFVVRLQDGHYQFFTKSFASAPFWGKGHVLEFYLIDVLLLSMWSSMYARRLSVERQRAHTLFRALSEPAALAAVGLTLITHAGARWKECPPPAERGPYRLPPASRPRRAARHAEALPGALPGALWRPARRGTLVPRPVAVCSAVRRRRYVCISHCWEGSSCHAAATRRCTSPLPATRLGHTRPSAPRWLASLSLTC